MKVKQDKKDKNKYLVESAHKKGKFYEVNIKENKCSCPSFIFRKRCKHIKIVEDFINKRSKGKGKGVLEFVKEKGEVDSIKLIEKFGEEIVDEMIRKGELMENKGKISLLR